MIGRCISHCRRCWVGVGPWPSSQWSTSGQGVGSVVAHLDDAALVPCLPLSDGCCLQSAELCLLPPQTDSSGLSASLWRRSGRLLRVGSRCPCCPTTTPAGTSWLAGCTRACSSSNSTTRQRSTTSMRGTNMGWGTAAPRPPRGRSRVRGRAGQPLLRTRRRGWVLACQAGGLDLAAPHLLQPRRPCYLLWCGCVYRGDSHAAASGLAEEHG